MPDSLPPPDCRTAADATRLARHAYACGDYAQAARLNASARHLLHQLTGDEQAEAAERIEILDAYLALGRGDALAATRHAAAALESAQTQGKPLRIAAARVASARVAFHVGDSHRALAELEQAWPEVERSEDLALRFQCENQLGAIHSELGQPGASIRWHRRAGRTARRNDDLRQWAIASANAAARWLDVGDQALARRRTAAARGAWERAVRRLDAADALAASYGHTALRAMIQNNRAAALGRLGRFEEAEQGFARVRELQQSSGIGPLTREAAHRSLHLAQMRLERGQYDAALREVEAGIAAAAAAGADSVQSMLHQLASAIHEAQGDCAAALAHFKRFHALREQTAEAAAQLRSKVMAVRLQTERALVEAARERERAAALGAANRALQAHADSLSQAALQDALTGLPNRRRFDAALAERHAQARARSEPLCVALLDVDCFKQINDRHSHAAGDRVLRQLGELLRRLCREGDLPSRWGGEEFAIILSGIDLIRAAEICERLRAAVERFDWTEIAPSLVVTVSIGVYDIGCAATAEEGLSRADALLYAAKRNGRNRVEADRPAD